MRKPDDYGFVVFVAVMVTAFACIIIGTVVGLDDAKEGGRTTPLVCPEDAVIVGEGNYTGGRGWDTYVCTPLDDLTSKGD